MGARIPLRSYRGCVPQRVTVIATSPRQVLVRRQAGGGAEAAREMTVVEVAQAGGDRGKRDVPCMDQLFRLLDAAPADVLHGTRPHAPTEQPREVELADMRCRGDLVEGEGFAKVELDVGEGTRDGAFPGRRLSSCDAAFVMRTFVHSPPCP